MNSTTAPNTEPCPTVDATPLYPVPTQGMVSFDLYAMLKSPFFWIVVGGIGTWVLFCKGKKSS